MKQRGRKSQKSLTSVANVAEIPRAAPPAELSEYEAHVWTAVMNTKPADWFGADTLPMLKAYCRHIYHAEKIDSEMAQIIDKPFDSDASVPEQFTALAKLRDRESRTIIALARSMRLTQQAQYHPDVAGTKAKKGKKSGPWDDV